MTDVEKLIALLNEFNIGYKIDQNPDQTTTIVLEEGFDNVGGYRGFAAHFEFDKDSKFNEVDIWE